MDLVTLIKERRSVFLYEDRRVTADLLTELLEAAVWAPNHYVTEPWRFVLVTGEGRRTIAEINRLIATQWEADPVIREAKGQKAFETMMAVPAFVVVIMKEDHRPLKREEDFAATCCMIQNFHLLAWDRGLGIAWKTYGLMFDERFRKALDVGPGEKVVGVLHVGYPAKVPQAKPRTPVVERITIFEQEVVLG